MAWKANVATTQTPNALFASSLWKWSILGSERMTLSTTVVANFHDLLTLKPWPTAGSSFTFVEEKVQQATSHCLWSSRVTTGDGLKRLQWLSFLINGQGFIAGEKEWAQCVCACVKLILRPNHHTCCDVLSLAKASLLKTLKGKKHNWHGTPEVQAVRLVFCRSGASSI